MTAMLWAMGFMWSDVDLTAADECLAADLLELDFRDRPTRLAELHRSGRLSGELATVLVPRVWRNRLDNCPLSPAKWLELFLLSDYTKQYKRAARPRRRPHLYRGATDVNRYGLSWTTNPGQAGYFARSRQAPRKVGVVWEAWIPPERLLAHVADESEYVVDARELSVRLAPAWVQRLVADPLASARPRWWWEPVRRLAPRRSG